MSGSSTWTDIPNGDIDQDSPATETLFTAIRDNIIAQSWSYYDDGDGVIYNGAVDGTVASVESPTFADKYEYFFILTQMTVSVTLSSFQFRVYWDQEAAWSSWSDFISNNSEGTLFPRFPRIGLGRVFGEGSGAGINATDRTSKIDKVEFRHDTGNITGGKIIMLRRHVSV